MNSFKPMLRRLARGFSQGPRMAGVYKSKSTPALVNSYLIFYLSQFDALMDNIERIAAVGRRALGETIFFKVLMATMGQQFTAGESLEAALPVVKRLQDEGFHIAMNYMAEFIKERSDPQQLDVNLQRYLNTYSLKLELPGKDFFNAVKLSALIDFDLLREVNKKQVFLESLFFEHFDKKEIEAGNLIVEKSKLLKSLARSLPEVAESDIAGLLNKLSFPQSRDPSTLSLIEWRLSLNCFNIINPSVAEDPVYKRLLDYTEEEERQIKLFVDRLKQIVLAAKHHGCFVLSDAEQTYVQAAINNFVEQFMYLYNTRNHQPVIFNTVQNYLVSSGRYIRYELAKLDFFGPEYLVALKLVRGAYLDEETRLSQDSGVEVVYTRKQDTDANYNANCEAIVKRMTDRSRLIIATHNRDSVDQMISIIEKGLPNAELIHLVYFATLYGLNEPLGYHCLDRGFKAVKYLPYGEREIILPYLLRRGKESKQLIQHDKNQLGTIRAELWQRLRFK